MYLILDYYTDEIIDASESFEKAVDISKAYNGSYITLEFSDEILYANIDLPF